MGDKTIECKKKDGRRVSTSFHYRKVKPKHLSMAAAIVSKLRHFGARICAVEIRLERICARGVKYLSNFTWLLYLSIILGDLFSIQGQFKWTTCTFTLLHFWRKKTVLFTPYNFISSWKVHYIFIKFYAH